MVRTVVFPVLRLLVWTVIAVALCVIAFRGGTGGAPPADGGRPPPVDLGEPTVPVTRGTVVNTVTVPGTVVADPELPVKATAAGTVRRLLVQQGQRVAAGVPLVEIRVEEEREPLVGTDAEGNPTSTPQPPRVRFVTVPAATAGTVTALDVLVDQVVAVGDRIGALSPGTLSVTAPLGQADQFRLLTPPSTAEVTVQGGPAPFACGNLVLGAPSTGTGQVGGDGGPGGDGGGETPTGGGTTARCAVPAEVTVFAGMGATVAIQAGRADDVVVVPVTAVQGSVQSGNVWVVGPDGAPAQRRVVLGLTDGEQIEVREGLAEGETVLQFVPVPDDTPVEELPMPAAGPFG